MRKRGILYSNFAKYYGKDDAPVLVWKGSTHEMNSNLIDDPLISRNGTWRTSGARSMLSTELISAKTSFRFHQRGKRLRTVCRAWRAGSCLLGDGDHLAGPLIDPSGGSADSMTLAIAHLRGVPGLAVLDAIRETLSRHLVPGRGGQGILRAAQKSYGISRGAGGDNYASEPWPKERFAIHGTFFF